MNRVEDTSPRYFEKCDHLEEPICRAVDAQHIGNLPIMIIKAFHEKADRISS